MVSSVRYRRYVALAIWGLTLLAVIGVQLIVGRVDIPSEPQGVAGKIQQIAWTLTVMTFATVGAIVAVRRPEHPVGWLIAVIGLSLEFGDIAVAYGYFATHEATWLPLGELALVASTTAFVPAAIAIAVMLPLLFPTGRLLSPRWRIVSWGAAFTTVALCTAFLIQPGPIEVVPDVRNPIGIEGPLPTILTASYALLPVLVLAALASVIIRYRRSRGDERLQLKWMIFAVGLVLATMLIETATSGLGSSVPLIDLIFVFAFVSVPISVGIAVLRYRLYDIDRIINRTIVYGAISALLIAVYFGAVVVFRAALSPITSSSDVAVAASTLAVAALFAPLRQRVQRFVDRRFYRSRYDAGEIVDAFTARLRDEVDLTTLRNDIVETVTRTVHPQHAGLWLWFDRPSSAR